MKTLKFGLLMILSGFFLVGCKSKPFGKKVNEPFDGNRYESNARYFRGTGKGESVKENIAWNKADMNAKLELAGQVNTTMKQVTDQYLSDKSNLNASDAMERFESLARQSMNTRIADLRKIGEKKYFNDKSYTVFIAYEIKKKSMLKFMKKQAELNHKNGDRINQAIIDMLEEELEKIPDEES